MDVSKFTVHEVEERSGIPATTLRQWERRYGFPKPKRSSAGYRLFSERDLQGILSMKRYISDGVTASRAAQLVQRIQVFSSMPRELSVYSTELAQALLNVDTQLAERILSEAYTLHTFEGVLFEIIEPALVSLGQHRCGPYADIALGHFASQFIQGHLYRLFYVMGTPQTGHRITVCCAPGEQHSIGPLIVAIMLRRLGYGVHYLGADMPLDSLQAFCQQFNSYAALISCSTDYLLQTLRAQKELLANIAPLLIFGGTAFTKQPQIAKELGGHYLAHRADKAVEQISALLTTSLNTP